MTPPGLHAGRSAPRRRPRGASLLPLVLLLAEGRATDAQNPVFPVETKLVVLQATVRNGRGELVTSLVRDAFTIYENGKPQAIEVFRREDVPVSIGLLIDNSGSMGKLRAGVEAAALGCLRASNPHDEAFVLNFADKAHVDVPFTSDLDVLEAGIARLDSIGGTAMRDAIQVAVRYLHDHGQRDRKVLLLITDGLDNASVATTDEIRTLAEESDIVVYAIGLLNEEDESKAKRARHELDQLTELTGGAAYYPAGVEGLDEVALGIARQIRSQYTLAYVPSEKSLDGSYRRLRVVARGVERLFVRTRAGYRATGPARPSPKSSGAP